MELEMRHLRAICAIADAGSLSRAAQRLGVSQPALTMLLGRVEDVVGARLFVRDRSGARPTELGENALRQARLLLAELDSFAADIAVGGPAGPSVRVGTAHLACVGGIVDELEKVFADFTVRVESSSLVLANMVERSRIDLAVIAQLDDRELPLPADIPRRTVVPRFPIFVALSFDHPLAAQEEIALEDLADEPWICPPGAEDGSLASLRAMCRRAGFAPRIRFDAPSGGGGDLIAAGHAVRLVDPGSTGGRFAVRPLKGDPSVGRLLVAWRRQAFTDDVVRDICRAVGRAYAGHAVAVPHFARWWDAHPEAHPWSVA